MYLARALRAGISRADDTASLQHEKPNAAASRVVPPRAQLFPNRGVRNTCRRNVSACYVSLLLEPSPIAARKRAEAYAASLDEAPQPAPGESSVIGNGTSAGEKLTTYSERMERLLDEMDGMKEDLKELKAEIKSDGFNVRALSKLVTIRRNKRTAEVEAELLNDLVLYAHATGTPLDLVMPEESESPAPARGLDTSAES
ncbi:MAG: GapR family DNA-binding domain-containing protein [Rhodoplanes sp.]